jgi:hypothetical protein
MRIPSMIAVLACCLLTTADQSLAQLGPKGQPSAAGQVLSRITPEQLAAALTQAGFRSQVTTGNNEKYVKSTMHGFNITVILKDCNNQGCGNYGFVTWFGDKVNLDFVNAWNNQWRFAKASIDSDGDLEFSSDVLVAGGVTLENVKENAKAFDSLLGALTEFKP